MQFRIQGKRVQCIRATYDPTIKRARQVVVAGFSRWSDEIPADEVAVLTDAERLELATWWAEQKADQDAILRRVVLRDLGSRIGTLVDEVEQAADGELSADQAAAAWAQVARLQKALKRAGHPRPKKPAQPAPAPEGQGDLLDAATPLA